MTVLMGESLGAQFIISIERDVVKRPNRRSGIGRPPWISVSEPVPSAGYPGNLSLPIEVREKILSTFRHTLDLYRDGKIDDCLIGCDFILKMDPRFAPARKLQEKARNPKAEIDLAELQAVIPPVAAPSRGPDAAKAPPPRETGPVAPPEPSFFPADAQTGGGSLDAGGGGLDDLSLDSLSLDGPLPDLAPPGRPGSGEPGLPFEPGLHDDAFANASPGGLSMDPGILSGPSVTSEEEIAALVKQGEDARAAGDRQQAIEIWSRIFLIDINNTEAVARIESTRREMAKESQRVATSLEKGQESYARGDLAAARTQFDAVLSLGESAPAGVPAARAIPPSPPAAPLSPHDLSAVATPADVLADELDQSGPPGGRRSWTSIPRPPRESEPEHPTAAPSSKRLALRISPRIAMIAAAALAVVAVALFFLPRSPKRESQAASTASGPTLEHATQLFREGKIDETTAELQQIPPGHPDYASAQKLLASLTDTRVPAAPPAAGSAPPASSREVASASDPAALRADAERALGEKRYIDALKSFSLAAPHYSGDPTFSQEMGAALEKVSELTPAVKLYNDGEYETAIPILWRIYQSSRDNQDARSYLLRAYYNQGVLQLQNGLYDRAQQSFGEVLALDPEDVESARHRKFAERYHAGELDLLGRIYVRYISPRP
jgi:tetratricopeptide (TPR) repeat protein